MKRWKRIARRTTGGRKHGRVSQRGRLAYVNVIRVALIKILERRSIDPRVHKGSLVYLALVRVASLRAVVIARASH